MEYVGRTEVEPLIKMATESYTGPVFPPKLTWYKIYQNREITGLVLAAVELLEVLKIL